MSVIKSLQNVEKKEDYKKYQLFATRGIFLATLVLFGVNVFRGELDNLMYLKIALLVLNLAFVLASFFTESVRKIFINFSLWLYMGLFFVQVIDSLLEGVYIENKLFLLLISIVVLNNFFGFGRMLFYTIISNVAVLIIEGGLITESWYSEFFIIHLVSTLALFFSNLYRVRSERSLVEIDNAFEKIFNALRDSVFLINPKNMVVIYQNHAADNSFNRNLADTKSKFTDLILPESQNTFLTAQKMIYQFKGSWEGELEFSVANSQPFVAILTLSYLVIQKEEMLFVKVANINKLKNAEKQLKELLNDVQDKNKQLQDSKRAIMNILEDVVSERTEAQAQQQKLSAVLDSIVEGVVVLDIHKNVYLYNNSVVKMLGYNPGDFNDKNYYEILHFKNELTNEDDSNFIDKVFEGEVVNHFADAAVIKKDGESLSINMTASPIFDEQKHVTRAVIVIRDATEQRKIERMRIEFVSVASHQLRTPLTSISWLTELLADPDTSPNMNDQQKAWLATIADNNSRMIALVNDLLNVSRIETGKAFNMTLTKQDIVPIINKSVEDTKALGVKKEVEVKVVDNGIKEYQLEVDMEKILQVILNLVNNAIKYSKPKGVVTLTLRNDDKWFYLDIQDQGIGIPKEQQGRIFEKFFRSQNAVAQQTEGTGLGTYISRSLSRAMGGDVTFVSEENVGTTFTLTLPNPKQ